MTSTLLASALAVLLASAGVHEATKRHERDAAQQRACLAALKRLDPVLGKGVRLADSCVELRAARR